MSHQVLSNPTSRAVGDAAAAIACAIAAPPDREAVARLHGAAWPMADAESVRGAALLAESQVSAECLERLHRDHRRLFVGGPERRPVAPAGAPASAKPSLTRLRLELAQTGSPVHGSTGTDLADALHALATLCAASADEATIRWRHELLDEHLLTWGARCLSRAQLGAQTFFYQGAAALGLGLLRHASTIPLRP